MGLVERSLNNEWSSGWSYAERCTAWPDNIKKNGQSYKDWCDFFVLLAETSTRISLQTQLKRAEVG